MDDSGQHLLFIDERFVMGGIATLIARVSRILIARGWRISLVIRVAESTALQTLPGEVVVHQFGSKFRHLYVPELASRLCRSRGLAEVDVIYATGVVSSWLGTLLSTFLPGHPRVLCGVYTTWEFCHRTPRNLLTYADRLRNDNFDRYIADDAKVFPSERIRQLHEIGLGRSLQACPICVLPIPAEMYTEAQRQPDRLRVVSIGRTVPYKTYNLHLVRIVHQLRQKGIPVRWDVYGTGELEPEMRRQIRELQLDESVHLHGNLEYHRLPEVLAQAGIFVGTGSVVFEAAFCRVPSVVALENDPDGLTYGCLPDHPLGSNGEWLAEPPTKRLEDVIERLLTCSPEEYASEMERHWRYVQPFTPEHVFETLSRCLANARPCRAPYLQFAAYNLHGLLRVLLRRQNGQPSRLSAN